MLRKNTITTMPKVSFYPFITLNNKFCFHLQRPQRNLSHFKYSFKNLSFICSTSLTKTPHVFSTNKIPLKKIGKKVPQKKFALILNGGSDNQWTEEDDYLNTDHIYNTLILNHFKPNNIKILYGDGQQKQIVVKSQYQTQSNRTYHDIPINARLSLSNIELEFNKFSKNITKKDILFIFIGGHGSQYTGGIQLWNENDLISIPFLSSMLSKINPKSKIIIHVLSCYSGCFLYLARKNIAIFSSSSSNFATYVKCSEISPSLSLFLSYLSRSISGYNSNLLLCHMRHEDTNYHKSDSLSFFIEKEIKHLSIFPYNLMNKTRFLLKKAMIYSNCESVFSYAKYYLPAMFLHQDYLILYIPLLLIKEFNIYRGYNLEEIYKKRLSKKIAEKLDRKMLKYFNPYLKNITLPEDALKYYDNQKCHLLWILSQLYEIQKHEGNFVPRYKSIFHKACIFLTYSLVNLRLNEISEFINHALMILDPLNMIQKTISNPKEIEELWGIDKLITKKQPPNPDYQIETLKIKRALNIFTFFSVAGVGMGYLYKNSSDVNVELQEQAKSSNRQIQLKH